MFVFEGMYGTSRSSYLTLEGSNGKRGARMIVRHSQKVDESKVGARSRFVESILIENADGERMLFPTNSLPPARAMTQHVNMGGNFADLVGQQISRIATEFQNLNACTSYVSANIEALPEGAGIIREQCRSKLREMKKMFERMYRSENGYLMEAKKLEDSARTLTENNTDTAIPVEKIQEVRKTLQLENSNILSDAVFEVVCNCLEGFETGINEVEELNEKTMSKMISVLGRPVSEDAWNKLKNNEIELLGKPKMTNDAGEFSDATYANKSGEMLHKLGAIVPLVKDDSLMNLLSFIVDRLPDEKDDVIAKRMRLVAQAVIKASGMSMNEGLSENNKAIRGFGQWINRFKTDYSLMEDFEPNFYERDTSTTDDAAEKIDNEFDAGYFLQSDACVDMLAPYEKHDAENPIDISDIRSALKYYLEKEISSQLGDDYDYNDVAWIADKKIGEVIALLAQEGYMISGDTDDNELEESDMDMGSYPDKHNMKFDAHNMDFAINPEIEDLNDLDVYGDDDLSGFGKFSHVRHREELEDSIDPELEPENGDDLYGDDDSDWLDGYAKTKNKHGYGAGERELLDDDINSEMEECEVMEDGDLTREDVLLPHKNQGESLAREVTPRTVRDPDSGKEMQPGSAYINRLRALSGMTSPNRQY
jgi:hypothetical protein